MITTIKSVIDVIKLDLYTAVCVYWLGFFLTLFKYSINKPLAESMEKQDAFGASLVFWPITWIAYFYMAIRDTILNKEV